MKENLSKNQVITKNYVGFYGRVSTKHQVEEGESLESQLFLAEQYVNKLKGDYALLKFSDEGVSASRIHFTKRPELMRMLSAAQEGKFSTLLVYKRDRLDRTFEFNTIKYILQKANVEVIYLAPGELITDDDPYSQLTEQIIVSVAAIEPKLISARVKDGIRSKALKGHWHSGNIPYGLYKDKETSKLIPIENEKKVIQDIFDYYVYKGLGSHKIANMLNEEDVPYRSPQNILKEWSSSCISYILKNTLYKGYLTYNDEQDGEIKVIRCKNIDDPIISCDIFDQSIKIRKKRRNLTYTPRRVTTTYLLRDIFYCSCGAIMYTIDDSYYYTNKLGEREYKKYTYYRCSRYHVAKGICKVKSINTEKVHKLVLSKCQKIFQPNNYEDTINELKKTQNSTLENSKRKIRDCKRRISVIKRKIEIVFENLESSTEPHIVTAYESRLSIRTEELKSLQSQLFDEKKYYRRVRNKIWSVDEISKKLADWSNQILNVSPYIQRGMILDVLSEVRLDENKDIKLKLNISLDNLQKIERGAHNYTYVHLFPLFIYVRSIFPTMRII